MHAGCCGWESGAWRDGGGAQPTVLSGEVTRGKGLQGGEGPAGEGLGRMFRAAGAVGSRASRLPAVVGVTRAGLPAAECWGGVRSHRMRGQCERGFCAVIFL